MSNASRELRIAPVMTGGTSLAVWMGGVTTELYTVLSLAPGSAEATRRSARRQRPHVYTRLLALTDTHPVVDVITGTSAGGLNGTLLAAALRLGISPERFLDVRTTWMRVADLDLLLRSPRDPNPPSLLQGDDYFVPNVEELLDRWVAAAPEAPETPPDLDLVTTVTTILAEPKYRQDDFDEEINEVSHAQTLRFRRDDFRTPDWPKKLAIAARTSASIPGVFEPSYLPIGGDDARSSGRPDLTGNASFDASRWAVDGGVVVNLPLTEALERIFDRPADREVRRVALFVAPTPSNPVRAPAQRLAMPPTIKDSLLTAVVAPRAEGVAADIDDLRRQNQAVERQARARTQLGPMVDRLRTADEAGTAMFQLYKERRASESVADTLDGLRRAQVSRAHAFDASLFAALLRTRLELFPVDVRTLEAPALVAEGSEARGGRPWGWGIRPIEQAVSIVIRLATATRCLLPAQTPPDDPALAGIRSAQDGVHRALATLDAIRTVDRTYWEERYRALPPGPASRGRAHRADWVARAAEWAAAAYRDWPNPPAGAAPRQIAAPDGPVDTTLAFEVLADTHRQVARHLLELAAAIRATIAPLASPEAERIRAELAVLGLDGSRAAMATVDGVRRQLLAVHVAQTVLLGDVVDREQPVELMQISFNSRNFLDPDRSPADKLAGPELARLGAFLKPSWRANDWAWGRMDGAYRLILLLADPQRIRRLHPAEPDRPGVPPAALEAVRTACGLGPDDELAPAVAEELDALYAPGGELTRTMPALVELLGRELQVDIACEELPNVAEAVARSTGNELDSARFARDFQEVARAGVVPPDRAAHLVRRMRIGQETVGSELGHPSMNRVITRSASVVVNALTGNRSGLPVVPRLLRPVRGPLQAVSGLVSLMTTDSPLGRGATAFVLAVSGAIVSLRLVGVDVPTGTFAISAILLVGLIAVAMVRSGAWWLALGLAFGATVVGLSLAGNDLGTIVYTTTAAVPADPVPAGTVIRFDDAGTVRFQGGDGPLERVEDLEVPAGGSIVLRTAGEQMEVPAGASVAGWKNWGFLRRPLNVFSVLAALVGLVLAGRTVSRWHVFRPRHRTGRLALAALLGAAAVAGPNLFTPLLTGGAGERAWKDRMVTAAVDLEGYSLELTLVVIVGASVLLGLGTDLVFSRQGRRLRHWLRTKAPGAQRA